MEALVERFGAFFRPDVLCQLHFILEIDPCVAFSSINLKSPLQGIKRVADTLSEYNWQSGSSKSLQEFIREGVLIVLVEGLVCVWELLESKVEPLKRWEKKHGVWDLSSECQPVPSEKTSFVARLRGSSLCKTVSHCQVDFLVLRRLHRRHLWTILGDLFGVEKGRLLRHIGSHLPLRHIEWVGHGCCAKCWDDRRKTNESLAV